MGDLARYLSDPHKYISSATKDNWQSLRDLRIVAFNASHTPSQHVGAAMSMFFSHLSAGDQSRFNPTRPLPRHLRPFEGKAFLSMIGLLFVFGRGLTPEGTTIAQTTALIGKWADIRRWIQYFYYRESAREISVSPSSPQKTIDETRLDALGEDWSVFDIIIRLLVFVQQDPDFFCRTLSKDGTFEIILKLWARSVNAQPPRYTTLFLSATLLFNDCLAASKISGNLDLMRAKLLHEVNGDAKAVATFITTPLRDAAKTPFHKFTQLELLYPLMQLIHCLLDGVVGGDNYRSPLSRAFCDNSKTDPRLVITKIMKKFVPYLKDGNPPDFARAGIKWTFQACRTLLLYQDAVNFAAKLLDDGILDVYAGFVPSLGGLTCGQLVPASLLLKQDISAFLQHEKVITAARNALHKIETKKTAEYRALKETESVLSDAWKYFTGHALARAILKSAYDAKYRKEDKLHCDSCHIRMNEANLKKCSGCLFTLYCSPECQAKSWDVHKHHCKTLTRNIDVYKLKVDTVHFMDCLLRADVMRHLPGLMALAERNPQTRGSNLLAYIVDYTFSPPMFSVIPASEIANEKRYTGSSAADPVSKATREELVRNVHDAKGMYRIVEVRMRGHAGTPVGTLHPIGQDTFVLSFAPVPSTFNPERPRAIDKNNKVLAVQEDWTDVVMADAIFGRSLSQEEFSRYLAGDTRLTKENQEKSIFERVDDAMKKQMERNMALVHLG